MSVPDPILYLVDDDPSSLTATARLLRAHAFAVKTFGSAAEFLKQLAPGTHGCVVADLNMPKMNGLDLQEALAKADQALPVVFLTGQGNIETSVLAMRHGAVDFVTKQAPKKALLEAISRALMRNASLLAEQARLRALRARFDALTPRDRQVLAQVLKGNANKVMATALGIDERSVKRHRASIMSRLRIDSVVELTRLVQEAGLDFDGSDPPPPLPPEAPIPA